MGQVGTVSASLATCNFAVHVMCKAHPPGRAVAEFFTCTLQYINEDYNYVPIDTLTNKVRPIVYYSAVYKCEKHGVVYVHTC